MLPHDDEKYLGFIIDHTFDLQFHKNWNLLMPIWLRIISLEENSDFKIDEANIGKRSVFIRWYKYINSWETMSTYHDCIDYGTGEPLESSDLKEALYKTIVDFIKWYNETNTK